MASKYSATQSRNSSAAASNSKAKGARQGRSNPRTQRYSLLESQTIKDVEKWREIYSAVPESQTDKSKVILNMISAFDAFCQEYIQELSKLAEAASPSQTWLENTVDNVLLDYWQPLLRAAEQNQADHYQAFFKNGDKKLAELQDVLEERLNFPMDEVQIVLYFEKTSNAKRFPFGSTYLIGIPLIDAYREDWMAIPHELGHHIYWNARFSEEDTAILPEAGTNFLEAEIDETMQDLKLDQNNRASEPIKELLNDWTEEIFADVVGARVAGKEFCEAAWERNLRIVEKKENLFLSDGEHPFPYLLPYIRASAAGIPVDEKLFEKKWQKDFGDTKNTQLVFLPDNAAGAGSQGLSISMDDLRVIVQVFSQKVTARLQEIQIDNLVSGPSPVDELKKFVQSIKKEVGGSSQKGRKRNTQQPIETEKQMLDWLLRPIVLEKHLTWTCPVCGTSNVGNPCIGCRTPRPASLIQRVVQGVAGAVNTILPG